MAEVPADMERDALTPEQLRFDGHGLIPAVVQDASSREVLMVAYMNAEALARSLDTGLTWFYSRSRQTLWQKGETSGNTQKVVDIRYDCDADCLLVLVSPAGPACHTGERSCFYRSLTASRAESDAGPGFEAVRRLGASAFASIMAELEEVIAQRKVAMPDGSYTAELLREGAGKIGSKVEEEAEEVARAAREESDQRVASEAADILYHLLVLLAARSVGLGAVAAELRARR